MKKTSIYKQVDLDKELVIPSRVAVGPVSELT